MAEKEKDQKQVQSKKSLDARVRIIKICEGYKEYIEKHQTPKNNK